MATIKCNRGGNKSGIRCYHCKKFGHVKANGWKREEEEQASYAEEEEEELNLCMVCHEGAMSKTSNTWFLDSGCSNHMIRIKSLFKEIDESYKKKVRLGDDKQM